MKPDEIEAKFPGLQKWRRRVAGRVALLAEHERLDRLMYEGLRDAAVNLLGRAESKKLAPVPKDSAKLGEAYRNWHEACRDDHAAAFKVFEDAASEALGKRLQAQRDAAKRIEEAASEITVPVVGIDPAWRKVEDVWCHSHSTIGLGASNYARGEVGIRHIDLERFGYQVRAVARKPRPRERTSYSVHFDSSHLYYPHSSFELWAWTCSEGARIIRHQTSMTQLEAMQACANFGCNPAAMWRTVSADLMLRTKTDRPSVPTLLTVPWYEADPDEQISSGAEFTARRLTTR